MVQTACLGRSLAVQPDFVKVQLVCGTVYGDMHYMNISYPVPNLYLVLHGLEMPKSTLMN